MTDCGKSRLRRGRVTRINIVDVPKAFHKAFHNGHSVCQGAPSIFVKSHVARLIVGGAAAYSHQIFTAPSCSAAARSRLVPIIRE